MPEANPYLIGNFAPVTEELTVERPLAVDGAIPPVLEGLLVRNGPNPVAVDDPAAYLGPVPGVLIGVDQHGDPRVLADVLGPLTLRLRVHQQDAFSNQVPR